MMMTMKTSSWRKHQLMPLGVMRVRGGKPLFFAFVSCTNQPGAGKLSLKFSDRFCSRWTFSSAQQHSSTTYRERSSGRGKGASAQSAQGMPSDRSLHTLSTYLH